MSPHSTVPDPAPVASENETRWFAEEVHAHDLQLKAYLRGSFPSIRDVDDVAQESYLRVWKARASQTIRSAKGFLFQIARHVATDILRRDFASPIKGATEFTAFSVLDSKPDAAEVVCSREDIVFLADAIDALPPRCHEIFILRKIQRMPQKEIAALLGISVQTVRVQVTRGMRRCEKFLACRGR